MKGEVTAAKHPVNNALEVDLDFEHTSRPPPVITEEITASLEDIIKQRIIDGRFDDVKKKAPPVAPPREKIEIDEHKSQKGLAEVYEEEYMRSTGQAPAPASESDEIKREAALLFKTLCGKLDALSHFHFAPKPVVEDMTIRADVPALAMEEIIPVGVSEAAALAPEEVFKGGGGGEGGERSGGVRGSAAGAVKAEGEIGREERKSRRSKHKRQRKGELKEREALKRARLGGEAYAAEKAVKEVEDDTKRRTNRKTSSLSEDPHKKTFTKSSQVFARLQEGREAASSGGKQSKAGKDSKSDGKPHQASHLKL